MDTKHYDTGHITVGNNKISVSEIDVTVIVIEAGSLVIKLFVDGVLVFSSTDTVVVNAVFSKRTGLASFAGTVVRVDISGARVFVNNIYLQLVDLGNGEQKHFSVGPRK